MKYIDADRLRKELDKRLKNVRDYMNGEGMKYKGPKYHKAQGKESAYDALLSIVDSLQQEQPDFPTTDEQMKEFLATHPKIKVPEKYKKPDWLFKKQEQPEVYLNENTMKKEFRMIDSACLLFNYDKLSREQLIAQRFYQLGLKSK